MRACEWVSVFVRERERLQQKTQLSHKPALSWPQPPSQPRQNQGGEDWREQVDGVVVQDGLPTDPLGGGGLVTHHLPDARVETWRWTGRGNVKLLRNDSSHLEFLYRGRISVLHFGFRFRLLHEVLSHCISGLQIFVPCSHHFHLKPEGQCFLFQSDLQLVQADSQVKVQVCWTLTFLLVCPKKKHGSSYSDVVYYFINIDTASPSYTV